MSGPISGQHFIEVMAPAVRQAAAVARALEGRVRNRPKAGETSEAKAALTLADPAAQEAILVPLLENFPEVVLRAEEDTPSVGHFPPDGPAEVVLDPIDGTLRSYLQGRGPYAIMLGLVVDGRTEAALVALPREGLFFDGLRGGGARRTRPLGSPRPVRAEADGPRVLVSHEMPEEVLERLRDEGFEPVPGCGGAISVAPLIPGVRAGLRIARDGDVSIRGRLGVAISRAGGAHATTGSGAPFPEAMDDPAAALVVAADAADLPRLLRALEAAPAPTDYMPV